MNKKQDNRMEGIEGVLGLMTRVSSTEEDVCQLREINRGLEECLGHEGERVRSLEREYQAVPLTVPGNILLC